MYSHETRVTSSQTGEDGRQTLFSLLNMMQDCSQFGFESDPVMHQLFHEGALALIISSRQVDILELPSYGENLKVTTGVYECKKFFGYRNTEVKGSDGKVYAKSWTVGVFLNPETGKPTRLPESVSERITYDPPLEMEYLDRKIRVPDAPCTEQALITAQHADIDFNKHVNNAQYIRMACEYLPAGKKYQRFRVEYKTPAKQGDAITPLVYDTGSDIVCVELLRKDRKPYAVIEFSQAR